MFVKENPDRKKKKKKKWRITEGFYNTKVFVNFSCACSVSAQNTLLLNQNQAKKTKICEITGTYIINQTFRIVK